MTTLMVISPVQCYYIGATDIAATMLIREVTRPLSFSKPVEKICEDLKKKDQQICELRYGECISQLLNLIFGVCVCMCGARGIQLGSYNIDNHRTSILGFSSSIGFLSKFVSQL